MVLSAVRGLVYGEVNTYANQKWNCEDPLNDAGGACQSKVKGGGGVTIGGYDDLCLLDMSGELAGMLGAKEDP
jgi:hypothetical protein